VIITPAISGSFKCFSQISASFFQSWNDMFSENFINGASILMLQISFISGAMFRISSASVEMTPPDFGSSLELIVPPVIIIAMVGNCLLASSSVGFSACDFAFSIIDASRISFSLIPML